MIPQISHKTGIDSSVQRTRKWKPEIKTETQPKEVFKDWVKSTSLHGVHYIIKDEGIYWKSVWTVAVTVGVICAVFFMVTAWEKFLVSPIVTTVENTFYPLAKVPFPAVTICPGFNIKKRAGLELLHNYLNGCLKIQNLNSTLLYLMRALAHLRYPFYHLMKPDLEEVLNVTNLQIFDQINLTRFMMKSLPTIEDMFLRCYWQGVHMPCEELFYLQRYEGGFCYSFNSASSDYCKNRKNSCKIHRNAAAGTTTGLEVFLRATHQEDHLGIGKQELSGVRAIVHDRSQIPETGTGMFMLDNKEKVGTMKVFVSITHSSDSLRSMKPSERNCYFADEKPLLISPDYSQDNCLIECRLQFIMRVCRCQPYFFSFPDDTSPECVMSDIPCILENQRELKFSANLIHGDKKSKSLRNKTSCSHCLPSCDNTNYDVDAVFAEDIKPINDTSIGYLNVYYGDQSAVQYLRAPVIDTMQLLVSFGGIAGLFLGFSLLSVAEIFYFFIKWLKALYDSYSKNTTKPQMQEENPSTLFYVQNDYLNSLSKKNSNWTKPRYNWTLE